MSTATKTTKKSQVSAAQVPGRPKKPSVPKSPESPKKAPASKTRKKSSTQAKTSQKTRDESVQKQGGKNQRLGHLGEEMACHYLKDNNIAVLERNWKCKCGEADIIAEEDETLLFVEVKTRSIGFAGLPEYAVTKQKRMRYEKIAVSYLSRNPRPSGRVRFDVIAIQMTGEQQCLLRHHRDAFAIDG